MQSKTVDEALKQKKKLDNLGLYFTIIAHTKKNSVDIISKKKDVFVAFNFDKKVKRKDRDLLMNAIQMAYGAQFRFIKKQTKYANR